MKPFQKGVNSQGKIAAIEANELICVEKAGRNESYRIALPEIIPIGLNP